MNSVEALGIALAMLERRARALERRNPQSARGAQLREAIETLEALRATIHDATSPPRRPNHS